MCSLTPPTGKPLPRYGGRQVRIGDGVSVTDSIGVPGAVGQPRQPASETLLPASDRTVMMPPMVRCGRRR